MNIKYKFVTKSGAPALPEIKKFQRQIKEEIRSAEIELPAKSYDLGKQAGRYMAMRVRQMVKQRGRRGSTGALAEALQENVRFRRHSTAGFSVYVGDYSKLPEYWAMINYGGYIKSGWVPGSWDDSPGGKSSKGKNKGKFSYAPGRGHEVGFMKPKKPIKGFHYIAFGQRRMLDYVRKHFNKMGKRRVK